jgi:hypothetical protein
MRTFDSLGIGGGGGHSVLPDRQNIEYRIVQPRLNRILSFTRLTIHDVINSPIARNQVLGYWKLSRQIDRHGELVELERQWNPNGLS